MQLDVFQIRPNALPSVNQLENFSSLHALGPKIVVRELNQPHPAGCRRQLRQEHDRRTIFSASKHCPAAKGSRGHEGAGWSIHD